MDKPYQINQSYHSIKNKLETDIALSLEQYLGSGDTTRLLEAENQLKLLKEQNITWLKQLQKDDFVSGIEKLEDAIQKQEQAGKLAANPSFLLVNNEMERHGTIDSLMQLVAKSQVSNVVKIRYQTQLLKISQALQQIANLRERYLQNNNNELKSFLINENDALKIQIEDIQTYPSLEVFETTEVDEFSFGEPETIDLAEENISGLRSLTNRYPKELSNTDNNLIAVDISRKFLSESLSELTQSVALFATIVDIQKQQITQKVQLIGIVSLLIFLILMVISTLLQLKTIVFIGKLSPFFDALTAGDFSQPLVVKSKLLEINTVSDRSTRLLNYLKELTTSLQKQSQQALTASQDLQQRTQQATQSTQLQRQQTELVSVSITQLSNSFNDVTKNAVDTCQETDNAVKLVTKAGQALAIETEKTQLLADNILSLSKLVEKLSSDTYSINNVLDVINNVSQQTNLLALNAPIEVARAGELGQRIRCCC
ncbi:methyl-accepting chemotaxis protein [Psychromonas sp. KJ10-10]|uniref:methyl-accepting chemotaxis protein n=1 Tax=Psychromonas sp. KJ10-10 TaxID=3391823 RepID=UPI0039B3B095